MLEPWPALGHETTQARRPNSLGDYTPARAIRISPRATVALAILAAMIHSSIHRQFKPQRFALMHLLARPALHQRAHLPVELHKVQLWPLRLRSVCALTCTRPSTVVANLGFTHAWPLDTAIGRKCKFLPRRRIVGKGRASPAFSPPDPQTFLPLRPQRTLLSHQGEVRNGPPPAIASRTNHFLINKLRNLCYPMPRT